MRLNGWQRLGVVCSVAWAVAGFAWGHQMNADVKNAAENHYEQCRDSALENYVSMHTKDAGEKLNHDLDDCQAARGVTRNALEEDSVVAGAELAILPIPGGWLLAYAILWSISWIRRGFTG